MTRRLLISLVVLGGAVVPSSASALVAPGRVTLPFMTGHREGVDPFSVAGVAVMGDGRIVTSGIDAGAARLLLTRTLPSGAPDPTFGGDGIVSIVVPQDKSMYGPFPGAPVLAPDGSIYVASEGPARNKYEGNQIVVTHVLADGTPDPAYGTGGSSMPGVQDGLMALASDGRILIGGHTGEYSFDLSNLAGASDNLTAIVARLTPGGALDPTFGNGGIVTLPGHDVSALAALPGGGAAVLNSSLTELAADGSPVPGFNHGAPLPLSGNPSGLLARADGSVDLLTTDSRRTAGALFRVRPDGTTDTTFGGGAVAVPAGGLVAGPAGSDLVTGIGSFEPNPGQPFTVIINRVLADGTPDPLFNGASGRTFALPFGGGYGTIGAIHSIPGVSSLDQTGFRGGAIAVRPTGGFVVAGAVGVIQYTGEGEGVEHEDVALAAFGPDLNPDPSFGGPAVPPAVSMSLPRQRASTAAQLERRRVIARLTVSTPGLCQVSVRARGGVVAKADIPVFTAGAQTAYVWLTKTGRKLLPHAHHATATARVVCEDFVGSRTTVNAVGVLR